MKLPKIDLSLRHKELATGLLVPLVLILGLGAAEGALVVSNLAKYGQTKSVEKSKAFFKEKETGLRLPVPGVRLGNVRINRQGFRGPELAAVPPPDHLRVAFVGSSTTYDGASPEGESWPDVTAQFLQAGLPEACQVEFLNAGLPGYLTDTMGVYFEHHVAATQPNLVVVLPGDVTGDNQEMLRDRGVDVRDHLRPSWLGRQSLLWAKIEKNLKVIRLQRAAHSKDGKIYFDYEHYKDGFEQDLRALVERIKAAGAIPALAKISGRLRHEQNPDEQVEAAITALFYNPYTSIPNILEARDAYNEVIERVANETGAVLIDGENEIPGDGTHFVDSMHFSPTGSARMGERVAGRLLANPRVVAMIQGLGESCMDTLAPS